MEGQGLWSSEQHLWLGAMGLTVYAEASSIVWPPAAPARTRIWADLAGFST